MATEYSLIAYGAYDVIGGSVGKMGLSSLTIASPCVGTCSGVGGISGLVDGAPIVFTTTGTLPTGILAAGTAPTANIYYARVTGLTSTTFHIYDTEAHAKDTANTTGRINTSGTQSGVQYITGVYWYNLSTADRAKYLVSGSIYRVFQSYYTWLEYYGQTRNGSQDINVDIVCEFADKFIESYSTLNTGYRPKGFKSVTMTSKINGVRTAAYHNKKIGGGYSLQVTGQNAIDVSQPNFTLDGLEIITTSYNCVIPSVTNMGINATIVNNIIRGTANTGGNGIINLATGSVVANNLVTSLNTGITENTSTADVLFAFNTVHNCTIGFAIPGLSATVFLNAVYIGNIANGCVTHNWQWITNGTVEKSSRFFGKWNYGDSSDDVVVTFGTSTTLLTVNRTAHGYATSGGYAPVIFHGAPGAVAPTGVSFGTRYYVRAIPNVNAFYISLVPGGAQIAHTASNVGSGTIYQRKVWSVDGVTGILPTTAFNNYASDDFYPASASAGVAHADATQVNVVDMSINALLPLYDMVGTVRPNYDASTYPTNKATAGMLEFDHLQGLVPNYPVVTISANVSLSGAEIRIYDLDNSPAGSLGTELAGTESNSTSTYVINTVSASNTVWIQIMLTGYIEYGLQYTIPASATALPIILQVEQNA